MIAARLPSKFVSPLLDTLLIAGSRSRLVVCALLLALIVAPEPMRYAWWDEAWTARKELSVDTSATGYGAEPANSANSRCWCACMKACSISPRWPRMARTCASSPPTT